MDDPVRVLIADDHPPTRAGVRRALEAAGFDVCAELDDAQSAITEAVSLTPDVCLLDIHMPGGGIAAAGAITQKLPQTAVVMLTVSDADDDLFAALRAGASGYLLKDMDPDRLSLALRGILAGEAAVPRHLMARVVEEFRGTGKRRLALPDRRSVELTEREWEVAELLRHGNSTAQMAERLFVSQVTIRRHLSSIYRKLRVPDRRAAADLLQQAATE